MADRAELPADTVATPWPLEPLPFGYTRWPTAPAEPATIALLMHRIRCLTETQFDGRDDVREA